MKKELFAGVSLGLLTGIIIGLSIAELTGIILGALTSLLAAFFGLGGGGGEKQTGNQVTIGSFGLSCVLAIFIGMYARTHNVVAPAADATLLKYRSAGFDTTEIKKIILFREFGLVPEGYTFSKEARQMSTGVLMAGEGNSICALTEASTLEDIQYTFKHAGGKYDKIQQRLSEIISDSSQKRLVLLYLKEVICQK